MRQQIRTFGIMKEDFLCFIWEHQYFNKANLSTCQGDEIQVIYPGARNYHAGPDFSHARIRIGKTVWVGQVEIHIKSSEWHQHSHHKDRAYDQVILHVVWVNNKTVRSTSGKEISVLELKDKVEMNMVSTHQRLSSSKHAIPCRPHLSYLSPEMLYSMLDAAFTQRIYKKGQTMQKLFERSNHNWDQVLYITLGRCFGFKLNALPFNLLASAVPLTIVRKLRFNLIQLEALYFGQAGFLNKLTGDRYYLKLQSEYQYLRKKFMLPMSVVNRESWRYLRLRPSNFPALRIAQFVSLMQQQKFTFSDVREAVISKELTDFELKPSGYWEVHYDFGSRWKSNRSTLGKSSKESLVINAAVPVLAGYAFHTGQQGYLDRAIAFTRQLPAEKNRLVSDWKGWGFKVNSAYDSQALIELNQSYCRARRCLDCKVGKSILIRNK